jgi:hypothetical protein
MRMALRGIVSVSADRDGARLLIPLGRELFILDRATGAAAVALGGGYPDSPLLSPDGAGHLHPRRDVWVVGVAGGKPRKLTEVTAPTSRSATPSSSPPRSSIAPPACGGRRPAIA